MRDEQREFILDTAPRRVHYGATGGRPLDLMHHARIAQEVARLCLALGRLGRAGEVA